MLTCEGSKLIRKMDSFTPLSSDYTVLEGFVKPGCSRFGQTNDLFIYLWLQYVHYEVDYSDVEMNKEDKGKDKKKDEKVSLPGCTSC